MLKNITKIHTGMIIDDTNVFTLKEIREACGISSQLIDEFIAHGIIEPIDDTHNESQFSAISLQRSQQALRLHQELGINLPGVALVLDLLNEVQELRSKLDLLKKLS